MIHSHGRPKNELLSLGGTAQKLEVLARVLA